ncbi:SpoIID/LytB domain-containing protein, partial [Actinotalea sp.]|uniref:SpoIID/LytB domain-containing protein n=1 Tax=Actinotalea sp. TaxID=1872145 RepID=UPI002C3C474B
MIPVRRVPAVLLALVLAVIGTVVAVPAARAAEEVYPAPATGAWTVDGRAYGHGRGLSQWGAQGAALQGRTASEILAFYYPGTQMVSTGNPAVRVLLAAYTPTTTVTIWSPENRPIRMGAMPNEEWVPPGRWTITVADSTVTAQRRDVPGGPVTETRTYTGTVRFETGADYGIAVAAGPDATTARWYRGDLRVEPTGGVGFNLTNNLVQEDYLRSVVPRESPASWSAAALQAQAVAARSYARYKMIYNGGICDTTACQ